MKPPLPFLFALTAALVLTGCATQTKEQLATVRAAKVSPVVLEKLEHRGSLTPADLIELRRRRVDDSVALRQLDGAGVDYLLDKTEVKRMKAAGVSDAVIEAAIRASNRFVAQFYHPYPAYGYGWYPYYGPGPWIYPVRPYGPAFVGPARGPGFGPPRRGRR